MIFSPLKKNPNFPLSAVRFFCASSSSLNIPLIVKTEYPVDEQELGTVCAKSNTGNTPAKTTMPTKAVKVDFMFIV
jgi:hypothetical protein